MFRIIGQYDIRRDGDLIRVWSSPEFNLEAARQYALDMMAMIEEMPAKFGTIVSFEWPPVVGPEVEEAMRRSARTRAERGMVAVAFVTLNPHALEVAREQWERIYAGSGITLQFFLDEAPALAWLHQQVAGAASA
ncbi:MAG: hypothetical protein ABI588_04375 [Arenimonas sp.]